MTTDPLEPAIRAAIEAAAPYIEEIAVQYAVGPALEDLTQRAEAAEEQLEEHKYRLQEANKKIQEFQKAAKKTEKLVSKQAEQIEEYRLHDADITSLQVGLQEEQELSDSLAAAVASLTEHRSNKHGPDSKVGVARSILEDWQKARSVE